MPTHSLRHLNTFNLSVNAKQLVTIESIGSLEAMLPITESVLVLGGGSNMLFTQDYTGLVLLNRIKGIEVSQDAEYHYLDVAGGENWHDLVMSCAAQGIGGLENLALIPGCVGAAPVQNIGAYGVEFADICESVDAIALNTSSKHTFSSEECQFSYRESVFKSRHDLFITSLRLKLAKAWGPTLAYGELKAWAQTLTAAPSSLEVAEQVIKVRQAKLPDPANIPNVGSFFKNPIIESALAAKLKSDHPAMPQYQVGQRIKLAAGWLIDNLGLKGYAIGGAAVHQQQALVLINKGNATSADVVRLAQFIRQQVESKFGVTLQPEVNFIDARGYSHLDEALNHV